MDEPSRKAGSWFRDARQLQELPGDQVFTVIEKDSVLWKSSLSSLTNQRM